MSERDHDLSNIDKCSLNKVIIFVLAVLLKSFASICAKIIMSMGNSNNNNSDGVAVVGTEQHSLLLTFGMFVSMSFALVVHALVMYFRIPFPGYNHHLIVTSTNNNTSVAVGGQDSGESSSVGDDSFVVSNGIRKMLNHAESDDTIGMTHYTDSDADNTIGMTQYTSDADDTFDNNYILIDEMDNMSTDTASLPLFPLGYSVANKESKIMGQPLSMYFTIAIPTLLDITATALSVAGLYYLDVSLYQMICNSNIVFVALMKYHILKNYLHKFQWVGMFWIVVSVFIGGIGALLVDQMSRSSGDNTAENDGVSVTDTLIGVLLVIAGTILNAVCVLVEEKLMKLDVPVPLLLLIGIEGLWGVVLSIFVMFPIGYALPGNDQGSYENPFNSWSLVMSSRNIQLAFFVYIVGILFWDICTTLVILQLSSMWYSISTIFSIAVSWVTDLFIFYYVNPKFGEEWSQYDFIQIAGIAVLVYGTAIYNAPNKGGLRLEGQLWAFGLDCSKEYSAIKRELEQIGGEGEGDYDEGEGDDDNNDLEEPLISATQDGNVVV